MVRAQRFARVSALVALASLGACADSTTPQPALPAPAPPRAPVATATPPAAPVTSGPPIAVVRPVTDAHFGTQVTDPYRWMEDLESSELQTWMKAQADFTRAALDPLPQRAELLARIKELDHGGDRVAEAQQWGGRFFYFKREQGHELPKYFVRDGLTGAERVLADPEALQQKDKHFAIDWATPSPDGKLLAYGVSESGSEASVLHIVDVASGKPLPDSWDRMQAGGVSWLDGRHFFYTRLQKVAAGAPQTEKYKHEKAYEHEIGRDPEEDTPIFGAGINASVPFTDTQEAFVLAPVKSTWVFAIPQDGVRNEQTVYYAPRASLAGAKTPWKKLYDVSDDVTTFDVHGDDAFLVTHKDALRSKVLQISLTKPDLAKAKVVIPESDVVVRGLGVAKDAVYVKTLDAGIGRLLRVPFGTGAKVENVALPVDGDIDDPFVQPAMDGAIFGLVGWTTPYRVYTFDPKTKKVQDTKLATPPPADFSAMTAEEVRVKSADGTMVPMSILHAKTFAKDGSHPTWLEATEPMRSASIPHFRRGDCRGSNETESSRSATCAAAASSAKAGTKTGCCSPSSTRSTT